MCYVNKVIFEMVNKSLKDTYLGTTTTTALKNEVSTLHKMNDDKETWVVVNNEANEFYPQFLF